MKKKTGSELTGKFRLAGRFSCCYTGLRAWGAQMEVVMKKPVYWIGKVAEKDDFGAPIGLAFYDAKTKVGPWAIMSEDSWQAHGIGKLGLGFGQKYEKVDRPGAEAKWVKVGG